MRSFPKPIAFLPLVLAGCSLFGGGEASNVMQIGKDSYTVRALSPKSTSEAKMLALQQANGYCKGNGAHSVMLVRDYSGVETDTNEKYYDLTFMCLSQNDRDFTRVTRIGQPTAPEAPAAPSQPTQDQPEVFTPAAQPVIVPQPLVRPASPSTVK